MSTEHEVAPEHVTDEELAEIERLDALQCTGISAGWCPIHGDCTCPRDNTDTREEQDAGCPLHGVASAHGDDSDEPPPIKRSLVLRLARELRALRAPVADVEAQLTQAVQDSRWCEPGSDKNWRSRMLRPHVERAAVLAREAEGLRVALRTSIEAGTDGVRELLKSERDLVAARAEIERLTKIGDAWKALAYAHHDIRTAQHGDGHADFEAKRDLARAMSALRDLGVDPNERAKPAEEGTPPDPG